MPDIRVKDAQGQVHVFPDGTTPEMIAKAMGVGLHSSLTPAPQGIQTPPQPEGFWHSLGATLGLTPEAIKAQRLENEQGIASEGGGFTGALKYGLKSALRQPSTYGPVPALVSSAITDAPPLLKKANEAEKEAMQQFSQGNIGQGLLKEIQVPGYMGAAALAPVGGKNIAKAGEQLGEGNIRGGLGTITGGVAIPLAIGKGVGRVMSPTVPKAMVTPAQTEALSSLIDSRGGAVDPHAIATEILPKIRNQIALDKVDLHGLKGRQVGQAVLKSVRSSIQAHDAEVATITRPYLKVMVDQRPIADAYRSSITPELQRNAPEIASRLEDEAAKFDQPASMSDVNALRIRLNNETAKLQSAGEGTFRKSNLESKADVAAVVAAREVQYSNLARLSGLPEEYIRKLQQHDGLLRETRDSLTKEFNNASSAESEHTSKTLRERVTHVYPSKHGVASAAVRGTGLLSPSPIKVLNNRLLRAFGDLPEGEAHPSYQEVQRPQPPTSVVEQGHVTQEHVAQEHVAQEQAYFKQAQQELGANANVSALLRRAQELKAQAGAAPPRPQAQPLPKLQQNRVAKPQAPSTGVDKSVAVAAIMMALKRGDITQQEADSKIQKLRGGGSGRLIRMPQEP